MRKAGFTYIELIIVIVIIGVISVIAAPMILNIGHFRMEAAMQKMAADLKFAREFAMNRNTRSRIVYQPQTSTYRVWWKTPSGAWVLATDPATKNDFIVQMNQGVYKGVIIKRAFGSASGNRMLEFDTMGTAYTTTDDILVNEGKIDLEYAGSNIKAYVAIAPRAGRIYAQRVQ